MGESYFMFVSLIVSKNLDSHIIICFVVEYSSLIEICKWDNCIIGGV